MIATKQGIRMAPIRVLLVDDSPLFLNAAARILAAEERVRIVGQVLSGQAALEQVGRISCDLVLVDVAMPHMNGLEVGRRLKELPVPPRVVLVSLDDAAEYRLAAAQCADAFVPKAQLATELLPLIRALFVE
jgi:DNA-binding NarL/FixJ family response regulator